MKKVFVFNGNAFDKDKLEGMSADELFDTLVANPNNAYFFDNEEKYRYANNNKMLFDDNLIIYIESNF